jgi:hypothetical protein
MALTLIGNQAPSTPWAVALEVNGAVGAITVTCYVGTASYLVRGTFANGRQVLDVDAPMNTDLVYIARDAVPSQSAPLNARINLSSAVLTLMSDVTQGAYVTVLADAGQSYTGQSTVHHVLGTNAPLVTVQAMSYRSGTYRLLVPTVDDWSLLRQMILPGGVMLLRSPCQTEYADTSFIVDAARVDLPWNAAPRRHRIVEIDYQAVGPDTNPPQQLAWTWQDVPTVVNTWADAPIRFPTWADLTNYVPGS